MVLCKWANENHSNQFKLKPFSLEEKAARVVLIQSSNCISQNPVQRKPLGHAKIVKLARANQEKQAKPKPKPRSRSKKTDIERAAIFAQKSEEAALKQSQCQASKSEKR